jgi:hypothetical protein
MTSELVGKLEHGLSRFNHLPWIAALGDDLLERSEQVLGESNAPIGYPSDGVVGFPYRRGNIDVVGPGFRTLTPESRLSGRFMFGRRIGRLLVRVLRRRALGIWCSAVSSGSPCGRRGSLVGPDGCFARSRGARGAARVVIRLSAASTGRRARTFSRVGGGGASVRLPVPVLVVGLAAPAAIIGGQTGVRRTYCAITPLSVSSAVVSGIRSFGLIVGRLRPRLVAIAGCSPMAAVSGGCGVGATLTTYTG